MTGSNDTVDVVIVGAGPSGAVAAKRLAEAGMSVTCLEQGDWTDHGAHVGDKPLWELMAAQKYHWRPNVRLLASDYPVDESESEIPAAMFNGVGGSAILYSAAWPRLTPSDFRVRSLDGVAADWPLDYWELEPFYERVEEVVGVSGLAGDPAYPPRRGKDYPMPPLPVGKTGMTAIKGMDKLGWHWWVGNSAIATRPHGRLNPCQRIGTCNSGCPEQAKSTPDITHWPDAIALGARLVTGARVSRVETDAAGHASGVEWIDRMGDRHFQRASIVILCANGIGTPRLLLMSETGRFRGGLANGSGLVGRNLMMHGMSVVIGAFEEDLQSWRGPFGQHLYSMEFYDTDASRGFLRGAKWQLFPGAGPMAFHAGVAGAPYDHGWGEQMHRNTDVWFGKSMGWSIIYEDLPDPENRVTLSGDLTDSDELPAPRIRFRVDDNARRLSAFHLERATEALEAAGAHSTQKIPDTDMGAHLLGTARMGDDPASSVVDRWGEAHDVPGLFIFDGSVFPTSGGVNPTATICALALRNAERIVARRRDIRSAA
ncbi:GMC family oxidoreductase [Croceicoccus mobilis]|uniref:Choline dehydrogenase n=1 Tax=Croceicoccus mobilis TaxID=1703339 RepID=A0A916Z7M7_9SPHN|nr:GMC family oxidoreductase [Croceicoccus mobilis]GGD80443.1 choline dehydrogenase [Croceicoccus mobilis]